MRFKKVFFSRCELKETALDGNYIPVKMKDLSPSAALSLMKTRSEEHAIFFKAKTLLYQHDHGLQVDPSDIDTLAKSANVAIKLFVKASEAEHVPVMFNESATELLRLLVDNDQDILSGEHVIDIKGKLDQQPVALLMPDTQCSRNLDSSGNHS